MQPQPRDLFCALPSCDRRSPFTSRSAAPVWLGPCQLHQGLGLMLWDQYNPQQCTLTLGGGVPALQNCRADA